MSRSMITVRIPTPLDEKLEAFIERTGSNKTDVVTNALAQYLNYSESVPLIKRMEQIEFQMKELASLVKSSSRNEGVDHAN